MNKKFKMNSLFTIYMVVLVHLVSGEMPMYKYSTEADKPVDLGDLTEQSWSVATKIGPDEAHYYKFHVESLTNGDPKDEKFHIELDVPPGLKEQNFTFYLAIWGMSEQINCKSNSKILKTVNRKLCGNEDDHFHDPGDESCLLYSRKKINNGYTILVGRLVIPLSVEDKNLAAKDVLVFEASYLLD